LGERTLDVFAVHGVEVITMAKKRKKKKKKERVFICGRELIDGVLMMGDSGGFFAGESGDDDLEDLNADWLRHGKKKTKEPDNPTEGGPKK
jgi:hypothetical protein